MKFSLKFLTKKSNCTRLISPIKNHDEVLLKFDWKVKKINTNILINKNLFNSNLSILKSFYILQILQTSKLMSFFKCKSLIFQSHKFNFLSENYIFWESNNSVNKQILMSIDIKKSINIKSVYSKNIYKISCNPSLMSESNKNFFYEQRNIQNFKQIGHKPNKKINQYSHILGFLSDFELLKSSKRINIISNSTRAINMPGAMAATNSIEHNHLEKKTFISKEDLLLTSSLSLLFYHKNFSKYKKLLFFSPQKVKLDNLNKDNFINNSVLDKIKYNTHIFTNSLSTIKNLDVKISNGISFLKPKNNNPKKFKRHLFSNKYLIKPFKIIKSNSTKFLIKNLKLHKINPRIFSVLKINFNKKYLLKNLKYKKNNNSRVVVSKNSTLFSKLFSENLFFLKKTKFYLRYSSYFITNLINTKYRSEKNLNIALQKKSLNSYYVVLRQKKIQKYKKYSKKNKKIVKKLSKLYLTNGFKIVKFRTVNPLNRYLKFLKKILKNKTNKNLKLSLKNNLLVNKKLSFLNKKKLSKLNDIFFYKKSVYVVPKFIKSRIYNKLIYDNHYPTLRSTKRFRVSPLSNVNIDSHSILTYASNKNLNEISAQFLNFNGGFSGDKFKNFKVELLLNTENLITTVLNSPFMVKFINNNQSKHKSLKNFNFLLSKILNNNSNIFLTNLMPSPAFKYSLSRKIINSTRSQSIQQNFTPWYFNTLIRFFEHCSGKNLYFSSIHL